MSSILWPNDLPSPTSYSFTLLERRRVSDTSARFSARTFAREPVAHADVTWRLNAHQTHKLETFYKSTLAYGRKRFNCKLPGPQGMVERTSRFLSPITYEPFGNGMWTAAAKLEVRYT